MGEVRQGEESGFGELYRFAASVKFTVGLLVALALLSAGGTMGLIPQGLAPGEYGALFGSWGARVIILLGLDRFHQSAPVQLCFFLLGLNLLLCGFSRSRAGFLDALGRGKPNARLPLPERSRAAAALAGAGFAVAQGEGPLRGRRRTWAFLGFPLVHLTPLVIILGAWWGTMGGFIGTANIHVGSISEEVHDWEKREDVFLPFALRVVDFRTLHYPLVLQVAVLDVGGDAPPEVEALEGRPFEVPGVAYRAVVDRFDIAGGDMFYRVLDGDRSLGPYSRGKEAGAPLRLRPLAYRDPVVRQVEAGVEFYTPEGAKSGDATLRVNGPVTHEGYRIYITNWDEDEEKRPYIGVQITRDPGQDLVWAGASLLCLGLFLLLFGDGGWVREEEGFLLVRAGRARRALLADALAGEGEKEEGA